MNPIILDLTTQEANWLLEFLDAGLRANGIKALAGATALHGKLVKAVQQSEHESKAEQSAVTTG